MYGLKDLIEPDRGGVKRFLYPQTTRMLRSVTDETFMKQGSNGRKGMGCSLE